MEKRTRPINFAGVLIIITSMLSSCNNKLAIPIKNGILLSSSSKSVNNDVNFFIRPLNSLEVKSCEKSIIQNIFKIDGKFAVLADGEYHIIYSNLEKCFVQIGDTIKRNKVIGEIEKKKNFIDNGYLSLSIKSQGGSYIVNSKIFKK